MCIGDVDIMCHRSNQLAIPAGYTPPTQLPGEFGSRVELYEIVNSEFPGYVYLWLCYLLTESVVDGNYNAVQCKRLMAYNGIEAVEGRHGPALEKQHSIQTFYYAQLILGLRRADTHRSVDNVFCMRCLLWPLQAADWPTRHRKYGWPDSATVDRVVSNGCDVVGVAHPRCRQDEWMSKRQWRLSFSRAEIILLNSWMPVQQIVYHMLRVFVKTEGLTASANNSEAGTLSNYHIKTLMLWACELKPRSWWTEDLNVVTICVHLLHTLGAWLTDSRCQHYYISNCNLFDQFANSRSTQLTENTLMSISRVSFSQWCIDSYVHKCAQLCPSSVSTLLPHDVVSLQNMVSTIVKCRLDMLQTLNMIVHLLTSFRLLMGEVTDKKRAELRARLSLTSWCAMYVVGLVKPYQAQRLFCTAAVFLLVAYRTMQFSLTDEMLDVLTTMCLQINDERRFVNARYSSLLSLSQAAILIKVVANNSHSTVQLIEIELSKAYLHRVLRCKDSDSKSIYCLANVYLAVLYYIMGHHQRAIDHCAMVTRLHDHCECSSHVVQGELLPRIDDQVDNTFGLAVFYQHIRAAALGEEHDGRHVSVFVTELFAHYLYTKFLSLTECCQLRETSLANEIPRYRNYFCNSPELFVTDVMLFRLTHCTKYLSTDLPVIADRRETTSLTLCELDTSKLVELLQQSAVEHLTRCRVLETQYCDYSVTADFPALYAYKCGHYRHCLQLSVRNVRSLIVNKCSWTVFLFISAVPELIQLMDDDLVSLAGLTELVNRPDNNHSILICQLSLSLYLMAQCQMKLRHSMTSLATTLDYVHLARSYSGQTLKYAALFRTKDMPVLKMFDPYLIKFVEQKILRYISVSH